MSASGDLGALNTGDWENLEKLADSLEEAWTKSQTADLTKFLPPPGTPARPAILQELIKTDLECRWRHGQAVVLDYYLEKFSKELGSAQSLPATLVLEEYRVRHLFGDRPPLTQFKTRFPDQFAELERLVAMLSSVMPVITPGANIPTATPASPSSGAFAKKVVLPQIGGYILIERIGTGAFAEVWKAEAPGGVLKAIKIIIRPLDKEEAQREKAAMELIKNLHHHFLLSVHMFWPLEDRLIILMDLADGSLRDTLNKCRKEGKQALPLPDLVKYLRQSAEAIDYLHAKKVYHRDIKPENILLTDGNVRVADFGLAKAQGTRRMMTVSFAGTPLYMPPEAWDDKSHLHGDQYSLAATYYELRVGRRLYKDSGLPSLMHSHLHETPILEFLGKPEKEVVLKALSKNPDDRYPSCMAFAHAIEKAVANELPPDSSVLHLPPATPSRDTQVNTIVPGRNPRISSFTPDTHKETEVPPTPSLPQPAPPPSFLGWVVKTAIVAVMAATLWMMVIKPWLFPDIFLPKAVAAGVFRPVKGTEIVEVKSPATGKVKHYYERIECVVEGVKPVEFVLVPWEEKERRPFYIMVDKVHNNLFAKFAENKPDIGPWRLGARLHTDDDYKERILNFWRLLPGVAEADAVTWIRFPIMTFDPHAFPHPDDLGISDANGDFPVFRVELPVAQQFADWLGGADAFLPSKEEWEHAAGRNAENPGEGPFDPGWVEGEIAVSRNKPLAVGTAKKDQAVKDGTDKNRRRCNDMAGNGLEWTRSYSNFREEFIGEKKTPFEARIILRGREFSLTEPLKWVDQTLDIPLLEPRAFYQREMLSFIGFRVMIKLRD